jgi:hypothetical protein
MLRYFLLLLIGLAIASYPFAAFTDEEEKVEVIEYNYGSVISVDIARKEISVSEFDWEAGEHITVIYSVGSDTVFEGAASLKDIKAGNDVSIGYVYKNDKKITKVIRIATSEIEFEDMMPESPDAAY